MTEIESGVLVDGHAYVEGTAKRQPPGVGRPHDIIEDIQRYVDAGTTRLSVTTPHDGVRPTAQIAKEV